MPRICVYLGSSPGASADYSAVAAGFGAACARRGMGLVYGGGGVGLMGVLADAALAAGGEVIGVIPRALMSEERVHHGLTELIPVASMHERKHLMAQLADAFVALPGGIGTLEELVEVFTWRKLGLHSSPVGLLNARGFYDSLLQFFDHMTREQFLSDTDRAALIVEQETDALLDRVAAWPP